MVGQGHSTVRENAHRSYTLLVPSWLLIRGRVRLWMTYVKSWKASENPTLSMLGTQRDWNCLFLRKSKPCEGIRSLP